MTERAKTQDLTLSVVVPVFNESEVIELTLAKLRPLLDELDTKYEVLLVNDGSSDDTSKVAREFASHNEWAELRILELQRNFGHMAALSAGLDEASGDWVAMMDGDLQHPPEVLVDMYLRAIDSGALIVQGVRVHSDGETKSKNLFSRTYYWLAKKLGGIDVMPGTSDFRVLSREVVEYLKSLPEEDKIYRLLLPWLGYETVLVPFRAPNRAAGSPSYSTWRSASLGISGLVGFSTAPLRLVTVAGLITGALALIWLLYVIGVFFAGGALQGWTSILAAVLILGSVQLIGIGILGEYLARAYRRLQGRPSYVLKK